MSTKMRDVSCRYHWLLLSYRENPGGGIIYPSPQSGAGKKKTTGVGPWRSATWLLKPGIQLRFLFYKYFWARRPSHIAPTSLCSRCAQPSTYPDLHFSPLRNIIAYASISENPLQRLVCGEVKLPGLPGNLPGRLAVATPFLGMSPLLTWKNISWTFFVFEKSLSSPK